MAGGRRHALPRVLDAVDARVRLLRLLVPDPRSNPQPRAPIVPRPLRRAADENPEGADDEMRLELLKVGPFCLGDANEVLFCPSAAKRTQRSGIFELRYLARDDREYCEARFARERLTPESHNASACRAELLGRLERCALSCDTCRAVCTSPAARGLVSTWKCGVGFPGLGVLQAFHESDIGQARCAPFESGGARTDRVPVRRRTFPTAGAPSAPRGGP